MVPYNLSCTEPNINPVKFPINPKFNLLDQKETGERNLGCEALQTKFIFVKTFPAEPCFEKKNKVSLLEKKKYILTTFNFRILTLNRNKL